MQSAWRNLLSNFLFHRKNCKLQIGFSKTFDLIPRFDPNVFYPNFGLTYTVIGPLLSDLKNIFYPNHSMQPCRFYVPSDLKLLQRTNVRPISINFGQEKYWKFIGTIRSKWPRSFYFC